MKFHSQLTENALGHALRIVRSSFGPRSFTARYFWAIPRWFWSKLKRLLFSLLLPWVIFLPFVVKHRADFLALEPWIRFVIGMWSLLEAVALAASFIDRVLAHPKARALRLMPVPGSSIVSWALDGLAMNLWPLLLRALLITGMLHEVNDGSPSRPPFYLIMAHALALSCVTWSTAALLCLPIYSAGVIQGFKLGLKLLILILVFGLAANLWAGDLPQLHFLYPLIGKATAWLPACSIGSATFSPLGSIVSAMWLALGGVALNQLPRKVGVIVDQSRSTLFGPHVVNRSNAGEEQTPSATQEPKEIAIKAHSTDAPEAAAETQPMTSVPGLHEELSKSLLLAHRSVSQLERQGWIEQLCWRALSPQQRVLLGTLWQTFPEWTRAWNKAWKSIAALVLVAGLIRYLPTDSRLQNTGMVLVWMGFVSFGMTHLVPLSNGLGRAFWSWPLGQHSTCIHCLLPVTLRELCGISIRLTWLRCLIALPPMLFGAAALSWIFHFTSNGDEKLIRAGQMGLLTLGTLLGLAAHRPLAILYRLQLFALPGRGWARLFAFYLFGVTIALVVLSGLFELLVLGGLSVRAYEGGITEWFAALGWLLFCIGIAGVIQLLVLKLCLWVYRKFGIDAINSVPSEL